ncbi:MAG: allophanate hydrolase [Pseudomonadota bacterium]
MSAQDLRIAALRTDYATGATTVAAVMADVLARVAAYDDPAVWIARVPEGEVMARAQALDAVPVAERGALHGVPFAVKDNIDVARMATTMACPDAAFIPAVSAPVVDRLLAAGAVLVGKTNLDQFATGLVGVRSPHGAPRCVFDYNVISGGSSSGSAVAVGAHLVSFSLGTDTAGSGRVPAAFNNIVGVKPTRGAISTRGVFPANRTLDCVSIFAGTTADASAVLEVAAGFDAGDPFSRQPAPQPINATAPVIGVPTDASLTFFGDGLAQEGFADSLLKASAMGTVVRFDYAPFAEAAALLYGSAYVAERTHAVDALGVDRAALHPVTRQILAGGDTFTAVDAFDALYRAAEATRALSGLWDEIDVMMVPTTPTVATVSAVEADPIEINKRLGTYTNFVNLMDLSAVAVPAGFRGDGLPHGVTFIAPAWCDGALSALAGRFHAAASAGYGRDRVALRPDDGADGSGDGTVALAVVGAHLTGEPLNGELTARGARLSRTTRTAGDYRLFALPDTVPAKPGLVRTPGHEGEGIEVEVWQLSAAAFGSFVAAVPPPLGIGTVVLSDGAAVNGFIAEPFAVEGAEDITHHGGWRTYRRSLSRLS